MKDCVNPSCEAVVPEYFIACTNCWFALPLSLRKQIKACLHWNNNGTDTGLKLTHLLFRAVEVWQMKEIGKKKGNRQ